MSAYNPPTRDSVIFNPEYFQTSLADLDTTYLNQNYLKFPFAQGLQNMQKVNITDTTESSDVNSGSLVTDGGIGLAKNLNVGGLTTATGLITANGGLTTGAGQVLTSTGTTTLTGATTATGLITANGGLTTGAGQVLTSTGTTTLTGITTATGLIRANGGLTTGAGQVLTSTGTTTLTGATTATGLITANGGLTTGAGQVLTSTGTTTLTGATTATGLITANGGLTTGSGQVLTSTGTTTLTGATTATGLITANGGLTMGGTNIITLGTGATAATSTQLGYTVNPALTTISSTIATGTLTKSYYSFTLPAGTWVITFKVAIIPNLNTATNAYLEVFLSTTIDSFTGQTGNQIVGLQPSARFQTITVATPYYNSTSKTMYLTIQNANNDGNITFNANTQCSIIRIA